MHYRLTLPSGEELKLTLIQNKILRLIYEDMDSVADEDGWLSHFQKQYGCPSRGIRRRKFLFDSDEGWIYTDLGDARAVVSKSDVNQIIEQAISRLKQTKYAKYKFLKALGSDRARREQISRP